MPESDFKIEGYKPVTLEIPMERSTTGEARTQEFTVPENWSVADVIQLAEKTGLMRTVEQDVAARRAGANTEFQKLLNIGQEGEKSRPPPLTLRSGRQGGQAGPIADLPFNEAQAELEERAERPFDIFGQVDVQDEASPLLRMKGGFSHKTDLFGGDTTASVIETISAAFKIDPKDTRVFATQLNTTGEDVIVYQNPETGRWRLWDKPGVNVNDVAGFTAEGLVIVTDLVGTFIGMLPQSRVLKAGGVTLGSAGGTWLGDFIPKLLVSEGKKLTEDDYFDMAKDSLEKAGVYAGFSFAGETLTLLGKAISNRIKGKVWDIRAEDLHLPNEEFEALTKEIDRVLAEHGSGRQLKLSAAQASESGELALLEEGLRKSPALGTSAKLSAMKGRSIPLSTAIAERDAYNLSVLEEFEEIMTKLTGAAPGERVPEKLRGALFDEGVIQRQAIEEPGDVVIDRAFRMDTGEFNVSSDLAKTGGMIRGVAEQEQQLLRDKYGPLWQKFKQSAEEGGLGDMRGDGKMLFQFVNRLEERKDQILFPGFIKEEAILRDMNQDVLDGNGVSLRQIQEGLELINYRLRQVRTGDTSAGSISEGALIQAKQALKEERARLFEANGRPDLIDEVNYLEEAYRDEKKKVDETIIGAIMQTKKGGGFSIADEKLIDRILVRGGRSQDAEVLARAIRDQGADDARIAIRGEILKHYRDRVFTGKNLEGVDIPLQKKHEAWIREYLPSAQQFLTEREIQNIDKVGHLSRSIQIELTRRDELLKRLRARPDQKLASANKNDIVDSILKWDNSDNTAGVMNIIKQDKRLVANVRDETAQRVHRLIRERNKQTGELRYDMNTLLEITDRKNPINRNLREIMGDEYANNLATLAKAVQRMMRRSEMTGQFAFNPEGISAVMTNGIRAFFAPPLSPKGRIFTAIEKGQSSRVINALGDAIEDPRILQAWLDSGILTNAQNFSRTTLIKAGLYFLVE